MRRIDMKKIFFTAYTALLCVPLSWANPVSLSYLRADEIGVAVNLSRILGLTRELKRIPTPYNARLQSNNEKKPDNKAESDPNPYVIHSKAFILSSEALSVCEKLPTLPTKELSHLYIHIPPEWSVYYTTPQMWIKYNQFLYYRGDTIFQKKNGTIIERSFSWAGFTYVPRESLSRSPHASRSTIKPVEEITRCRFDMTWSGPTDPASQKKQGRFEVGCSFFPDESPDGAPQTTDLSKVLLPEKKNPPTKLTNQENPLAGVFTQLNLTDSLLSMVYTQLSQPQGMDKDPVQNSKEWKMPVLLGQVLVVSLPGDSSIKLTGEHLLEGNQFSEDLDNPLAIHSALPLLEVMHDEGIFYFSFYAQSMSKGQELEITWGKSTIDNPQESKKIILRLEIHMPSPVQVEELTKQKEEIYMEFRRGKCLLSPDKKKPSSLTIVKREEEPNDPSLPVVVKKEPEAPDFVIRKAPETFAVKTEEPEPNVPLSSGGNKEMIHVSPTNPHVTTEKQTESPLPPLQIKKEDDSTAE